MELFKLFGTIAINNKDANSALDETSGKAKEVAQNVDDAADSSEKSSGRFGSAMSKIGSAAVAAAKVVGAGMIAVGGAVAGLTTKSIQAYADYEQLVGGVETLFKDSADVVMQYAENAYKTAGLSANAYMETVTSFSASLLQSLDGDTKAAADKANVAITDMSDNANKMGTSMEMIQNAYQGFAKANYTMLDNLKLGYGGTGEEMQRLLKDAEAISGIEYDISSYADIVDAIHVIQTEMGITGTTAKEASSTISGSFASMKASWKDMMSAMANEDADFGAYVDRFVESASTVGDNLLPRIGIALNGAVQLIERLAPVIIAKIPELFSTLLPSVVGAAKGMVSALGSALPGIASSLLPKIWDGAGNLITGLANFIQTNLPIVTEKAKDMVSGLGEKIKENLPVLISKGLDILMGLSQSILQNIPTLVATGMDLIKSLVMGIVASLPELLAKAPEIITNFANTISRSIQTIFMKGLEIIWELIKGIVAAIPDLVRNIPQIIEAIFAVWNAINWTNLGKNLIKGITNGIKNMGNSLKGTAKDLFGKLETLTANAFKAIGNFIMHPINTAKTLFSSSVSGIKNFAVSAFNALKGSVSSIFNGIKNAITNPIQTAKNAVKTVIDAIKGFFNFKISWPKIPMPHFGISPSGWGIGDLLKGSIPKLSIDWYAKAMDKPMIMDTPTIFGYNPATGTLMGGGEAGSEVVSGTTTLLNMIRAAVAAQNSGTEYYLQKLVEILADYFPQIMERMNDPIPAVFDTELAADRLAKPIDKRLGVIAAKKERGR
jgi:phage-related protein